MTFGTQIRELRQAKNLTLRDVAKKVKVTFTYVSKIENQKLSFGEFPSDEMILKLARALDADPDRLLLLAEKVPESIRNRVLERPDAFRAIANLDDRHLDEVLEFLDQKRKGLRFHRPRAIASASAFAANTRRMDRNHEGHAMNS
jgi:transcriptional regulator with XRE-family HTH domain